MEFKRHCQHPHEGQLPSFLPKPRRSQALFRAPLAPSHDPNGYKRSSSWRHQHLVCRGSGMGVQWPPSRYPSLVRKALCTERLGPNAASCLSDRVWCSEILQGLWSYNSLRKPDSLPGDHNHGCSIIDKFTQGSKADENRLTRRLVTDEGELDYLVRDTCQSGTLVGAPMICPLGHVLTWPTSPVHSLTCYANARHLRESVWLSGCPWHHGYGLCSQQIQKCREQQRDLYMVFIDLTKAFDSVTREGLWQVLRKTGCPEKFIRIIQSFHDGTRDQVIDGGNMSVPFDITSGTRQGRVLAPLLFCIFFSINPNWS